ncbi:MAG TPA: hypothetical protein VKF81_05705, partial [Blastocatellia bacterium]|nr:hypothetical protein [Blastocatellia bacterium]
SSTYQRSVDQFVNPTHGSGWIVQAQPTGAPPIRSQIPPRLPWIVQALPAGRLGAFTSNLM